MSESTGMPSNPGMIFDAVMYKGLNSNVISDDAYQNQNAVQSNAPEMVLMDTDTLQRGSLTGKACITIFWDSTAYTDNDISFELFKDGVSEFTQMLQAWTDVLAMGSPIIYAFDPKSEYRIVITSLTENTVTLDYIRIEPIPPSGLMSSVRVSRLDKEIVEIVQKGGGSLTGGGTVTTTTDITFPLPYTDPPYVYCNVEHELLNANATNISETGFTLAVTHVGGSNWSSAWDCSWMAVGPMDTPFSPGVLYY